VKKTRFILWVFPVAFAGCHHADVTTDVVEVKTPVTVTTVSKAPISEHISLNATSSYLKKNIVKSNIAGFIEKNFVSLGDYVEAGKPLFIIKTKEAEALSQVSIRSRDTLFTFKGEITVRAAASGTITEVNRQTNDYVNDGDQLAVIADQSSFVFLLNIPFEFNKYASAGTPCTILLPDSSVIPGTIGTKLSIVDPASQTQPLIVKPGPHTMLPESLLVSVSLAISIKLNAQVLVKTAVLSDETMEHFWVMKLINDTTAVKVPVIKGISAGEKIEIISPVFDAADRIINSGHYGLPDTAYVTILNQ
jgi:biotin carboxyl carrier protein